MSPLRDVEKVLKAAPIVRCPGCAVEMTLRTLDQPTASDKFFCGVYRCPGCGTETTRRFRAAL